MVPTPLTATKKSSSSAIPVTKSSTMKQGTLFSFFSKTTKTETEKPSSDSQEQLHANTTQNVSSNSSSKNVSLQESGYKNMSKSSSSALIKENPKLSQNDAVSYKVIISDIHVGTRISVYWPDDDEYYTAKVTSIKNGSIFTLLYDDGDVEHVDLRKEDFKILSSPSSEATHGPSLDAKKKKVIVDDDEEFEFEENIDSSEEDSEDGDYDEEYSSNKRKIDSDEDGAFESDDEDEANKKRVKPHHGFGKRLRITSHTGMSIDTDASSLKTTFTKQGRVTTTQEKSKNAISFITPPPKSVSKSLDSFTFSTLGDSKQLPSMADGQEKITPSPRPRENSHSQNNQARTPLPNPSIVNNYGTHWHHHFTFLSPGNRRDLKNRPMMHPEYDPRTLYVDYNEIERVTQSKLTPASRQWWEIKAQYADTLLLFKTGKFYEIFHMDADAAVQVLGFTYMKGAAAHAGFPEIAYGGFCDKLVRAGYKVARVEQTETPEMLKERKSATKGPKPQVINREVCSIVSSGTRTFCFLDDTALLEEGIDDSAVGPLLAIKESLHDSVSQSSGIDKDDESNMKPSCEYGIVLVDAIRGVITVGQFVDDLLRSRMNTLLTSFRPSEVLIEGTNVSSTLLSLLKSVQSTTLQHMSIETIHGAESFPKSTAVSADARKKYERPNSLVHPWDVKETLTELHRRAYYPRSSRKSVSLNEAIDSGISRWPDVLKACVNGGADLALSAFGSALFYLQRALIDEEILGMGIVKAYCPPEAQIGDEPENPLEITEHAHGGNNEHGEVASRRFLTLDTLSSVETTNIDHMSLDGTTITNLEILTNSHSHSAAGSLWSKINGTKSAHGSRLLKAWLLRPLFRKEEIDRRADAVEELISGSGASAMSEARGILSKLGDIERLLSRVHSMSGNGSENSHHPNERAVLYETATHTKRKVGDFSKLLNGLRAASKIPDIFEAVDIRSGLLKNIVRVKEKGGLFPDVKDHLDWFFDNFDCDKAAKGHFEPSRGIDDEYDSACDTLSRIKQELDVYQKEMCQNILRPSHVAKNQWSYINTKDDSKDKYLIELPVHVQVPDDFVVKGKRYED